MRLAATMLALLMLAGCGECLIYVPTPWRTSQTPVPLTSEPSHHLVLSNPYVRVFRVEAAPHASTLVHRHDHDYMWVSLGPSDITNNVVGKDPAAAHVEDGEVRFVAGGFAHSVTNNSSQPFRNITIELLQHGSRQLKPGEDEREMTLMNSGSIERLLLRDGVRASEIELKPGGSFSRQKPGAHLVIALAGVDIWTGGCQSLPPTAPSNNSPVVAQPQNQPTREGRSSGAGTGSGIGYGSAGGSCGDGVLNAKGLSSPPEIYWSPARSGSQYFRNAGPTPARILILDF